MARPLLFSVLTLLPAVARPMRNGQLSIVTWNLLAPHFASPAKYPWAPAEVLGWPARQRRILSQLASMDADVVCLQEVEVAQWDEFSRELGRMGYAAVLQDMKRQHPVANAVCVREGHVELVRTESRSRAMIAVLRTCPPRP